MSHQTDFCSSCGKEMFEGALFCTYCGTERQRPIAAIPTAHENLNKVFEVKKIGICSIVKFSFMFNAFIGLALGILFASIGMAGIATIDLPIPLEGIQFIGTGLWIGFILGFPIIYGLMGAVLGAIFGILYNILAWGVGGIKITLKSSG